MATNEDKPNPTNLFRVTLMLSMSLSYLYEQMVLIHHQTQLFICKQTLHSIQQRVLTSTFVVLITNLLPRINPPSMQEMSVIIRAKHIIIIIIIIIIYS